MASLNCYPRTPNGEKTAYSYSDSTLDGEGLAVFWNTVTFNQHGVSQLNQRELKQRLKTKCYFKDFQFNVASASTVRHPDDFMACKYYRYR